MPVPVAVPADWAFCQVTFATATLSDAVPATVIVPAVVFTVEAGGETMVKPGGVWSVFEEEEVVGRVTITACADWWAESAAVTVIVFAPSISGTAAIDHCVVPAATPLNP